MNQFWHYFVIIVVLGSFVAFTLLLHFTAKMKSKTAADETTGHVWDDDLEELNMPLPKWWFYTFIILTIWALFYVFYYPALGNDKGTSNWTAIKQYKEEVQATNAKYNEYYDVLTKDSIEDMAKNSDAIGTGRRLFLNNCSVCHGSDAGGATGYPNLSDKDWLYGGDANVIVQSITNGRNGLMPAQSTILENLATQKGMDKSKAVEQTADYVLTLSGLQKPNDSSKAGKILFDGVCSACHTVKGTGMLALGAANLTDDIWLHSSGSNDIDDLKSTITDSINNGRSGTMPAHKDLLSEKKIKVIASYIYSLSNN